MDAVDYVTPANVEPDHEFFEIPLRTPIVDNAPAQKEWLADIAAGSGIALLIRVRGESERRLDENHC